MNWPKCICTVRIPALCGGAMLLLWFALRCSASTVLGPAGGAQLVDSHWDADNGAPAAGVASVVQTNDGYLWIASIGKGQLSRFDGRRFEQIPIQSDRLSSSAIYSMFAPKTG